MWCDAQHLGDGRKMSKFNKVSSTASDVLNPLKDQRDFCDRASRFSADETRAYRALGRLRRRIGELEATLESHVEAAKLFKTDGLRGHKNIEDIRARLNHAKVEYRDGIKDVTRFLNNMDRLEQMAVRDLGSVPYYRSIS
jgi:hypothetical protein